MGAWSIFSNPESSTQKYVVAESTPHVDPIAMKLSEIQAQLASLQKGEQRFHPEAIHSEIASLNQNIVGLKEAVVDLQATAPQDASELKATLTANTQSLASQLSDLKTTLDDLKKQETPRTYLPVSTLPWAIAGIDVRNYEPVVVRVDGFGAIAKGQVRDGWKLITVQFDPPLAVFQNVGIPSQYVRITQHD